LGSPGEGYVVFQAMVHAASNAKLPFSTRAAAVESLGRLNYTGVSGIDPLEAATKIAASVEAACAEAPRLAKQAGYSMADSGRWMRQQVGAAALALAGGEDASQKGIASLAKSDQQARVFDLQKIATAIAEFLDDKKNEDTALDGPAEKWRGDLESWLKK